MHNVGPHSFCRLQQTRQKQILGHCLIQVFGEQGHSHGGFPLPGNHLLRNVIFLLLIVARRRNEHVHSEAGMARQGKFKCHDGSKANAIAVKTSVKVSLPSLHDKWYLSLTLCSPSDLGGNSCTPHS